MLSFPQLLTTPTVIKFNALNEANINNFKFVFCFRLLYHDSPKVSGSWFPYPKVISNDVCYPPKGSHPARSSITFFNVTDLIPGGDGGYVFVTQGGVGSSNLCLHLKTQRGKGYRFDVDIYGYYY